jgi:hypothetical protein
MLPKALPKERASHLRTLSGYNRLIFRYGNWKFKSNEANMLFVL